MRIGIDTDIAAAFIGPGDFFSGLNRYRRRFKSGTGHAHRGFRTNDARTDCWRRFRWRIGTGGIIRSLPRRQ